MPSPSWTKVFPATVKGVIDAAAWLETVARAEHFPEELSFGIQICVEELFANVVRHGGGSWVDDDASGAQTPVHMTISVTRGSDAVEVVLEDNGKPFDVAAAPPKVAEGTLDEIRPGGLGIKLIKEFSSGLTYQQADEKNRTALKFLWPQSALSLQ